jgi:hypothetical protein
MAGIDKIFGTQEEYIMFQEWLEENGVKIKCNVGTDYDDKGTIHSIYEMWNFVLYPKPPKPSPTNKNERFTISNFSPEQDRWLYYNCPLTFIHKAIAEQYGVGNKGKTMEDVMRILRKEESYYYEDRKIIQNNLKKELNSWIKKHKNICKTDYIFNTDLDRHELVMSNCEPYKLADCQVIGECLQSRCRRLYPFEEINIEYHE